MTEAMTEWFMGTGTPKPETYEAVHHHSKLENNNIQKGVGGQRLPDRVYMMGKSCLCARNLPKERKWALVLSE